MAAASELSDHIAARMSADTVATFDLFSTGGVTVGACVVVAGGLKSEQGGKTAKHILVASRTARKQASVNSMFDEKPGTEGCWNNAGVFEGEA